jgi:hypothetical protein
MDQHSEASLEANLSRWQAAELITPAQHQAIVDFERAQAGSTETGARAEQGLSLVAELSIYLGMVLVIASGALAASRLWSVLGFPGRSALGLIIVAVSIIGTRMLREEQASSLVRLRNVLEACGASGAAMTTAIVVDAIGGHVGTTTVMVTGLVFALVNGFAWRNTQRSLAFLGSVAGSLMVVAAAAQAMDLHLSTLASGLLILSVSVVLLLAAQLVLQPKLAATMLSQIGMFVGSAMVTPGHALLGLLFGLVTASVGVGLGIRSKTIPVTALGLFSFAFFTIRLLAMYVRGPLAILITFGIGVGVVIFVLRKGLATKKATHEPSSPRTP